MSKKIKDTGRRFGNFIADKIAFDDLIGGVKGKIVEAVDNPLFSFFFSAAYSKIPEEHDERVESITNSIIAGDKDQIQESLLDELVEIIHTPLGDKREKIVFSHLFAIGRELIELESEEDTPPDVQGDSVGGGGPGGDPGGDPPGGD